MSKPNAIEVKVKWVSDQRQYLHSCVNTTEGRFNVAAIYLDEKETPSDVRGEIIKAVTR